MKLQRFYVAENLDGDEVYLENANLVHQLTTVFRFRKGDNIILFNGDGYDRQFEIEVLSKAFVRAKVHRPRVLVWTPPKKITLYLAHIRKERFEWAIEKCTELGVSHIVPIETERTERSALKKERAEKIIQEAAEQCCRGDLPTFSDPKKLKEIVEIQKSLFACDISGVSATELDSKFQDPSSVLIGPEGGWSPKELALFEKHAVQKIKLGETTLRAETAAVVATALLAQ